MRALPGMDAISLAITGHFKILVNAYVSDFLVDDHWQKVPPSWHQFLENADNELWAKLLDPSAPVDVLPLSLLCLRQLYGRVVATRGGVRVPKEIPPFLPGEIDSDPEIHRALSSFSLLTRRVFAFYCIRLLLAPFVEYLLVSDRLSFIHENGFPASFCLFNPVYSPTNIVIVAIK